MTLEVAGLGNQDSTAAPMPVSRALLVLRAT
ncbi:MAG: hypothetical protein QOJ03_3256, partial [Frankiaceae bacterium]|nr:hypothetical protein [Frankiaceae bacterium]